ncbi:galacturonan 1,4-alpha-galacturonidase [Ranunculus cassubicifolius]
MCNGSLEKWIFLKNRELSLGWQARKKIILDIAKGISYLHHSCRNGIIHLDIKPHNILLDGELNAKLSDFGLARFIDRDRSHVLTAARGTQGYMAPECWKKKITEKADVYSFGIVVLEIICGRRNLEHSLLEEYGTLLHLVREKAEAGQLSDLVDKQSEDMQQNEEAAVKMIRVAISCLWDDSTRRPSMSMLVKILEDDLEPEMIHDYSFLTINPMESSTETTAPVSAPQLPEILSGPRCTAQSGESGRHNFGGLLQLSICY